MNIISALLVFAFLETTLVETQSSKNENNDFTNIQYDALIIDDNVLVADLLLSDLLTDQPALISNLVFQPKLLDFLQRPIGSVNSSSITLFNRHDNQSVYLGSITSSSSSTSDFYSSTHFEEKVIPPKGNSTFQVVFLPRQIGQMNGLFQIHTSFGMLRYTVKGEGTECPYRLQPLVGLKAPLNATISPEILMYNPHDTTLQINEIYSSGGNFQLELPSGGQEGPQVLWEIPPHSTKPIIRVRFTGRSPGNHTAYVRIKLSGNDTKLKDKILVVPIEIEILNHTGIYSKIPFIDLGVVGDGNKTFKYNFNLINSGNRFVDIKNWLVESNDPSLVDSVTLNLQRFTRNENIADRLSMEIDWRKLNTAIKYIYGTIVLNATVFDDNYAGDQKIYPYIYKIPFAGQIIKGHIDYQRANVSFYVGITGGGPSPPLPAVREFMLKNVFSVPLSVTSLNVPDNFSQHFVLAGFKPVILSPGDSKTLFRISMRVVGVGTTEEEEAAIASTGKLITETFVKLTTNVSVYDIPIVQYASLLRRVVPFDAIGENPADGVDEKEINFGILPVSTFGEMLIAFINENPIPIAVRDWEGTFDGAVSISTIPRGCGRADTDSYKLTSKREFLMLCDEIKPGEMIVFQVSVLSDNVGTYNGRLRVKTDYEELITSIKFTTAMGRLEVLQDQLQFKDCFPGKVCSLNLHAYSTFMKKMTVEGVSVDNGSVTYEYADENEGGDDDQLPEIAPNQLTNIGRLTFDPRQQCQLNCYSSFDLLSKPFGVKWMSTLDNYTLYSRLDNEKLMAQLQLFNATREFVKNVSFRLTTTQVRRLEYNATINFVWPKMLTETVIQFPVIQVDQEAVKFITLHNPSDHLLFVHYILHDPLLHGTTSWMEQIAGTDEKSSLLKSANIIYPCENCSLGEGPSMFGFLFDEGEIYVNYVKPKSFVKVGIKFTATMPGTFSTILYMRNNLTTLDAVWITGKAAVPQFKFGNRKPGSPTALLFEIVDKHTKVCEQPVLQAISTKRTFTARNYGEVPILISGILVDDALCEGYGFKILDCSPFELAPNASKKIEISFAPDFTLARVTRTLYFDTDIGPLPTSINFSLVGTIPPHSLEPCIAAVVRPSWEAKFKNIAAGVLTLAFVLVIIVAYFDSDRILKDHIIGMSKDKGPIQPPLDLRQIGLQQNSTVASPTNDTKKSPETGKHQNGGSQLTNQSFNAKRKLGKKLTFGNNNIPRSYPLLPTSRAGNSILNFKNTWNEITKQLTRTKTVPAVSDLSANKSPQQSTNKPQNQGRDNNRTSTSQPPPSVTPSLSPPSKQRTTSGNPNNVSTSNTNNNNRKKPKEKVIEEDALSTSTESSSQSEESISSLKHEKMDSGGGASGKKVNGKLNLSLEEQRTAKLNVKKTKSLPLGYDQNGGKDGPLAAQTIKCDKTQNATAPVTKSVAKVGNGLFNGQHNIVGNENGQENKLNENALKPQKKYGKTPGRERKVPPNQTKNAMNSNSTFKGTAFTFSSPISKSNGTLDHNMASSMGNMMPTLPSPPPNSTNIWGNDNKISFSDIVAKNTLNDLPLPTAIGKNIRNSMFEQPNHHQQQQQHGQPSKMSTVRRQILQDGSGMLKNHSNEREFVEDISQTSTDLGPIGTRKSPSSTPSWDSIQKPIPISQSHSYNSNSLFSVAFPQHNQGNWSQHGYMNYMHQTNAQQQRSELMADNGLSGNSGLWNSGQKQNISKLSMWSSGAALQQQQQHQQQQQQLQQQQQQHLLQQQMTANNWNANNSNNSNNYIVRPPPGFNFSAGDHQDLHRRPVSHNSHEENNSHQQHQQYQQQQHHHHHHQQQQQQHQQSSNPAFDSQLSTYDPFRLIQSIWDAPDRWGASSPDDKKQQ